MAAARSLDGRIFLAMAILLVIGSLGLPWIALETTTPLAIAHEAAAMLGAAPGIRPLRGYEIPWIAERAKSDPLSQAGLAAGHVIKGNFERAWARVFDGDRREEELTWLTYAPAALALLHLLLFFRRLRPGTATTLGVLDLALAIGSTWVAYGLATRTGAARVDLLIGVYLSIGGLVVLAVLSLLLRKAGSGKRRAARRAR